MRVTNKNNYPSAFVNAVMNEISESERHIFQYPERMGVTTLIDSPRVPRLLKEKYDQIEADVDDWYELLDGICWDRRLCLFEPDGFESQKKIEMLIDGITLVGKMDLWIPQLQIIADYKRCKVAALRFEHDSWINQLNCYAYMAEQVLGVQVKKLLIYPLLKDWRHQEEWRQDKDYPPNRIPAFELPLWPQEEQKQYIEDQLHCHLSARNPECSAEEKWQKEDVWAVMKEGRQSALRVLPNYAECEEWCALRGININGGQFSVVKRSGECVRCKNYCSVRSVCDLARVRIDVGTDEKGETK